MRDEERTGFLARDAEHGGVVVGELDQVDLVDFVVERPDLPGGVRNTRLLALQDVVHAQDRVVAAHQELPVAREVDRVDLLLLGSS